MPLYEYECSKCQKVHEVMQKFSDAPLQQCPECGGQVAKRMSMTSFMLKGSGWYSTDYKKRGSAEPPGKTESGEKKSDSATPVATEPAKPTNPKPAAE